MIIEITTGVLSGGAAGAFISWLAKSVLTERIKGAIKSEYDKIIETYKSEIKAQEMVSQAKWEIKREACLKAFGVVDGLWANMDWDDKDKNGNVIKKLDIELQAAPSIEDIRKCNNELALSCDSKDVLTEYIHCLNTSGELSGDAIVDLRNAIRVELGFGEILDFDRDTAFIGRVNNKETS